MRIHLSCLLACLALSSATLGGQQPPAASQPEPVFHGGVNLILVDVVVRDRNGAVVRGLMAEDFEVLEDGMPQKIASFAYDEVASGNVPAVSVPLLAGTPNFGAASAAGPERPARVPAAPAVPMTSQDVAGHRLMVLLFDTSSMQPEDVQQALDSALKWTDKQMTTSDLVAVVSIGSTLKVLADFTGDKGRVHSALMALSAAEGIAPSAVDASTMATDEASALATDDTTSVDTSAQELDTFNNDVRLRALTTLSEALTPIQQKKVILYFSSGMQRNGTDNQVELRKAVNAAARANVAIYPVDARGLQAVVPGGSARQASRGGVGAFSGRNVGGQFGQLAAQQETLQTLATDTGGTAFTDTNDFGEAFARVTRDTLAYYILGFASTNPVRDGRFRRITVRLRTRGDLKLDARQGYWADRDFAHTGQADRELALQEQLMTPIPATDLPVFVTTGWFRLTADRYYVPVSLALPGSAVPVSTEKLTLDVAGAIADERGLPVARIRDTVTVPPASADTLSTRQVLYQTGVSLPPGRFSARIVVRENTSGRMGSFETPVIVPDLRRAPVKVSSVVLSTQLQQAGGRKTANPLVREGTELVPNLTHFIGRDQKLYVYYEVYDPVAENGAPAVRTSLVFYRGKVKAFETPVVEHTQLEAADRHATLFEFEIPPGQFKPGLYTCQLNIVDEIAGRFTFPRVSLYVH